MLQFWSCLPIYVLASHTTIARSMLLALIYVDGTITHSRCLAEHARHMVLGGFGSTSSPFTEMCEGSGERMHQLMGSSCLLHPRAGGSRTEGVHTRAGGPRTQGECTHGREARAPRECTRGPEARAPRECTRGPETRTLRESAPAGRRPAHRGSAPTGRRLAHRGSAPAGGRLAHRGSVHAGGRLAHRGDRARWESSVADIGCSSGLRCCWIIRTSEVTWC